ncbi:MAG: hypothetical protein OXI87_03570 [Albidovulum sp.]|nr:hypothetical protein [Albidovulum sp.]MDE0529944.1 hypothetical protein [Albidovulum sp.]
MRENLPGAIGGRSPAPWARINMLGEYEFSDGKLRGALGIPPPEQAARRTFGFGM